MYPVYFQAENRHPTPQKYTLVVVYISFLLKLQAKTEKAKLVKVNLFRFCEFLEVLACGAGGGFARRDGELLGLPLTICCKFWQTGQ